MSTTFEQSLLAATFAFIPPPGFGQIMTTFATTTNKPSEPYVESRITKMYKRAKQAERKRRQQEHFDGLNLSDEDSPTGQKCSLFNGNPPQKLFEVDD